MSEKDNRQLMEEAFAMLNKHDLDAYLKLLDEAYVWEGDLFPQPLVGREAIRQALNTYFAAFPDLRWEKEQILASGDHVVTRSRLIGTHKGEFKGIAPTNRQVNVRGCQVHEIRNGKFIKAFGYADQLTLMQQLGVSMAKAAAR